MPIMTHNPTPKVEKKPNPIEKEFEYKSAIEDNKKVSHLNLVSHIVGAPWSVTYYAQQVSQDDELQALDVNLDPVYQQYHKVKDLELKVASYLSQSQSEETGSFEVTGESHIYPPLQPNKYDLFTADIGDGIIGLFSITNVERLTILKETCYSVSYVLIDDVPGDKFTNLEEKVIKSSHFIKKLLQHDEDPIVVDEEYNAYLTLSTVRKTLLSEYLNTFYDKRISSIAVPDQEGIVYDGNIVKFLKAFTEVNDNKFLKKVRHYTYELPGLKEPLSIFDAIIRHYEGLLPLVNNKFNIVHVRAFSTVPQYNGIYYTKATGVIFPIDTDPYELNNEPYKKEMILRDAFDDSGVLDTEQLHVDYQESDGLYGAPLIKPVAFDDFYVFSGAFYAGDRYNMSDLERMVYGVINGEPIDHNKLHQIATSCNNWLLLDKYYYVPIVLLLIKMAIHGL